MRRCGWCGEEKPEDAFYRQRSGKFLSGCKACRKAYDNKRPRNGSPEQRAEWLKRWRHENPEKVQAHQRRQRLARYGLTPEAYAELLAAQQGGCAICGRSDTGALGENLYVDHDHRTNKVRGLLCHHCNAGLGHAGDSVERLIAMAAYLLQETDVIAMKDYSS